MKRRTRNLINRVRQRCPHERDICNWNPPSGGAYHQTLPPRTRDMLQDMYADRETFRSIFTTWCALSSDSTWDCHVWYHRKLHVLLERKCSVVGRSYHLSSPCKIRPKWVQPGVQRVAELRSRVGISEPTKICRTPKASQWDFAFLWIVLVPLFNPRMAAYDKHAGSWFLFIDDSIWLLAAKHIMYGIMYWTQRRSPIL